MATAAILPPASDHAYVPRRLFWLDAEGQRHVILENGLSDQARPVVVLAEPGAGKSELFRHIARLAGAPLVTATKWLRTARPETLIVPGKRIFIDALSEASARRDRDAVQRTLEKLDAAGGPHAKGGFAVALVGSSARSSDWGYARGAAGETSTIGG